MRRTALERDVLADFVNRTVEIIVLIGLVLVSLVLLTSCSTPISGNPAQDVAQVLIPKVGITDLQDAAWNFDQAMAVGALTPDDPASPCLHQALQEIGAEGPPAPSFKPRQGGLVSAASIAYIRAQQLKRMQGGVQAPVSCDALVGRLMIDQLKGAVKLLPGGGLLP